MDVDKQWCLKKKKGIKIIDPNPNLSKKYLRKAEETLEVMINIKDISLSWTVTTKYYFRYFTIYAFLLRIGIKSEIHECTLEMARILENLGILPPKTYDKFKEEKKDRIESQYYLREKSSHINIEELRDFYLTLKEKIELLSDEETNQIREKIKEMLE